MILGPIAATLMQLALSRSREYEADHDGAALLGSGASLATALEKIERGAETIPMIIDPNHAQAYIINPLTGRQMSFAKLFSSHPPTADRIARLRAQTFGSAGSAHTTY
jgi:heat shock protein HtpX